VSLPAWMYNNILGKPIADWLWVLGWAFGATVAIVLLRRLVIGRLSKLAEQTDTMADDMVVAAARSIRKTYVLLIAIGIAMGSLYYWQGPWQWIKAILSFVAVLQALRTANILADAGIRNYAARKDSLDKTTLRALSYAVRVVAYITIILIGLEFAGFRVQTLLTGLGVGGIAIALAVQNILGDLFAALSIVLDKPFVVGDAIAVDAFEGDVVHIGLKSTRVRSINGEEVVFSNADLLKSRLRNLTRRDNRRYGILLHLDPSTTAEQIARVPQIVEEAVRADGRSTLQRSHVRAITLAGAEIDSSILINGKDWFAALDVRHAVLLGILRGLEREKIRLASSNIVAPTTGPLTIS
jgi:small-conductance mechanosensitive channel